MARFFDAMDVQHHWVAGWHVDWRTGVPDDGRSDKSHCSAFVAAACMRLGVYILRPPEHGQIHLATAQALWLQEEGRSWGWCPVASPFRAQALANEGQLVVAAFPSPDPRRPGHVALLRASDKPDALIQGEGPQIIQVGEENLPTTSLKVGFRHHPRAWVSADEEQIAFYSHDLR